MDAQRELLAKQQEYDPDLFLWRFQTDPAGPMHNNLLDLFNQRLRTMDEYDVDMHVLGLTSTGVQMLDADKGTALATLANDRCMRRCRSIRSVLPRSGLSRRRIRRAP